LCQKADICTAASEFRGYSITSSAGALKIGRNEHYGEGRKRANIHADFVCGISVRMSGDPPGAVAGKTATFDPAAEGWEHHADEGFLGLVGPIWQRPDGDSYRYAFLVEDKQRSGRGGVQGGMLMTFADRAMGRTCWYANERQPQVTVQFDMHFIAAVKLGEFVEARCTVVRRTRALVFMAAELMVGERVVATAKGIWKMLGKG
jgi:acyl-coenzyme A thioesterase PaaI-like protein